jgi:hypothetical protein
MLELELGPILRSSVRQRGAFATLVLQVAASFTVGSWLLLIGLWVRFVAERPNGFDTRDLVSATVREPATVSEATIWRRWPACPVCAPWRRLRPCSTSSATSRR